MIVIFRKRYFNIRKIKIWLKLRNHFLPELCIQLLHHIVIMSKAWCDYNEYNDKMRYRILRDICSTKLIVTYP